MSVTSINGLLLKRMIISGANSLNSKKDTVDSLNVFPVPDGDTGTNMSLTVLAAAREVDKSQSLNVGEVAKLASNGSLRGARGNSGVITSQLFRGFAKELEGIEEADTVTLAKASAKAVETAYKAVMKPKEGTILTVARVMSESALKYCHKITDVAEFMEAVIKDGQTMNPSTEDILNAINNIDADNIVIMPNNKNIILAAEQARNLTEDKKVFVIPTKSMPEAISAMLCYNAEEDIDSVVEEMKDAIANVNTASVTYAVRDTKLGDKEITKGDILGMLNDNIEIVGKDIQQSTKDLINEAVNDDSEIICIYYGSDATEEMANEIAEYAEENFPDCDIEVHSGNQQLYYYIISVE